MAVPGWLSPSMRTATSLPAIPGALGLMQVSADLFAGAAAMVHIPATPRSKTHRTPSLLAWPVSAITVSSVPPLVGPLLGVMCSMWNTAR